MNTLLPLIITWLQFYGYPVLWLCVCIAAIGAPLPIGLLLLATGAFAALGDFNIFWLFVTTLSASVCGDSIGYWIGRKIGPRVIKWLSQQRKIRFLSPKVINRSQEYFQRRGGWGVFLSRCLVPALGGTINVLAGAERYPYKNFLLADATGEALGQAPMLILGFAFGANWEVIGDLVAKISTLVVLLLIALYLVILLIRMLLRMRAGQVEIILMVKADREVDKPDYFESHADHKMADEKENPKKAPFLATFRQARTYKSTDGSHTDYNFPKETTSNPGRRD